MTREELLEAYENGERDFSGKDFSGIDLSYTQLAEANFSNCNFAEANLQKGNFSDANFTNADFTNCNLNDANCRGAILTNANFTDAHLNYANFQRAILINANFTNANQQEGGANFSDAIFDEEKEGITDEYLPPTKTLVCFSGKGGWGQIKIDTAGTLLDRRFAQVGIELEKCERYETDEKVQYQEMFDEENRVALSVYTTQDQIPEKYWDAVKEGVKQIVKLLPFSLIYVNIKVVSGAYHKTDSNEESFRIAASDAMRNALKIANVEFYVPYYITENDNAYFLGYELAEEEEKWIEQFNKACPLFSLR